MSKQKTMTLADQYNVRVTRDGGSGRVDYHLDSPTGYVFATTFSHVITAGYENGSGEAPAMWRDLADALSYGITECDNRDCALCADEEYQRGRAWLRANTGRLMTMDGEWVISNTARRLHLPIDALVPVSMFGITVYMTRDEVTA